MWGSCCFNKGDVKVTLGTGSFLNLNSGTSCHASVHGLYPLVAWRVPSFTNPSVEELFYCIEGASNDTGSIVKWAIDFGLFVDPSKSSDIAYSVEDSDGCYFIPAFSGLGVSYIVDSTEQRLSLVINFSFNISLSLSLSLCVCSLCLCLFLFIP